MRLVFDIETNGLYNDADTIWCICAKDVDNGTKYFYHSTSHSIRSRSEFNNLYTESISFFLDSILGLADEIIGHNILNFDLPVLKKICNWEPFEDVKITDTLVMSRLANPDRPQPPGYTGKGGSHSLEAWGYRVGKGKPDHEEWNVFSTDMLRRCREDVEINVLLYHTVSRELEGFTDESIKLEHDIARIISDQEHYGIRIDVQRARDYVEDLTRRIEEIDRRVVPRLPKTLEIIGTTVTNPFLKTGGYRKQTQDYYNEEIIQFGNLVCGPYNRIRIKDFDLGSTEKIKSYLLDNGWTPESWNYSKKTGERTSPKLEGSFKGVDGEIPRAIKERITWRHRRSQIEGWIKNAICETDHTGCMVNGVGICRLPGGANTCGTNTGRMRHFVVVNIPKANSDEVGNLIWDTSRQEDVYGTQMRSLFIPRDGYVLVGHDASGLELRMLAHYMDDNEFTQEILNGDIHTFNQEKAGLPNRASAKTFIYALIYGAGDAKIGSIVGGDAKDGLEIKEKYFGQLTRLKKFIESVKRASSRGYLKGLDGRKVFMRRDKHGRIARSKAPNTLLQSAGAIVMKQSCRLLWDEIKSSQIKAHKVLDMHDEGQSEVWNSPEHIEPYCELAVNSIVDAGTHFNLNIPLAAEYKVGNNMAETH